jgi:hypothetical protein
VELMIAAEVPPTFTCDANTDADGGVADPS